MSGDIKLQAGAHFSGFEIRNVGGCRLVFGPVPLREIGMLMHGFSDKAVMATDIADLIGAAFVIGEPDDIKRLREMDLPVSEKRHADYLAAAEMGLHRVAAWLRRGQRGASSNAMCKRIFGVPVDAGVSHPHDPDDLRRCLLFLDAAEAHDKVALMADVSPQWASLAGRWADLVALFREEVAAGSSAPKTYELMKELLNG